MTGIALVTTLVGPGNVFVPMIVVLPIDKTDTLAASRLMACAITGVAAIRAPTAAKAIRIF